MKRLILIASVLGWAALVPWTAQAQRGGGFRGSVGAPVRVGAGFVSRPGGGIPVRTGFAPRPISVRSSFAPRPTSVRAQGTGIRSRILLPGQRAFNPRSRFAFNRFNRFNRFHNRRFFFNNCFNTFGGFGFGGFGCSPFFNGFGTSPFLSGGFGFPFVDPFFGSEFQGPQQQQQQPVVAENQGDDRASRELAFEVQTLRDEMLAMHDEEQARNQARNNPPARSPEPESAPAVLVFRDGRQLSARNYAISDHTIWVLSPNSARKFAVADLDVQATEQANAKNGVEFRLPQ